MIRFNYGKYLSSSSCFHLINHKPIKQKETLPCILPILSKDISQFYRERFSLNRVFRARRMRALTLTRTKLADNISSYKSFYSFYSLSRRLRPV